MFLCLYHPLYILIFAYNPLELLAIITYIFAKVKYNNYSFLIDINEQPFQPQIYFITSDFS